VVGHACLIVVGGCKEKRFRVLAGREWSEQYLRKTYLERVQPRLPTRIPPSLPHAYDVLAPRLFCLAPCKAPLDLSPTSSAASLLKFQDHISREKRKCEEVSTAFIQDGLKEKQKEIGNGCRGPKMHPRNN